MFLNNKQTPRQEYKIKLVLKALAMARAKYKGENLMKMRAREGKIVMIMDNVEKVIIMREANSPEPMWLINADDLNNEEMVRNLVEPNNTPDAPRQAAGRK